MSYKSEYLTSQIRQAREGGAISQRDLSARSGLTQSHISQIERGTLEPGLSSFIDLARALDLELVVVPRKLLPAVNSIVGGAMAPARSAPSAQISDIGKFERLVRKHRQLHGSSADLDRISDSLRLFRTAQLDAAGTEALAAAYGLLKQQAGAEAQPVIRKIALNLQDIRDRIAQAAEAQEPKPAYGFNEADGDA